MKSAEFTGKPGGDCECWCLFVTDEEYRRVKGEKDYKQEKEFCEEMDQSMTLYPSDFFRALGIEDGKKIRFRLEILEEDVGA